ncbi:MAG: helix-turn-helix transcriptional regulator [Clostridia bacterium]|nr:helix-turn-helix transcriptional regulator [Clostridia bacterium]
MSWQDKSIDPRLLSAAREAFLSKDYEMASLSEICRAAGVTTGALSKRYDGKEALLVLRRSGGELVPQRIHGERYTDAAGGGREDQHPLRAGQELHRRGRHAAEGRRLPEGRQRGDLPAAQARRAGHEGQCAGFPRPAGGGVLRRGGPAAPLQGGHGQLQRAGRHPLLQEHTARIAGHLRGRAVQLLHRRGHDHDPVQLRS